LRTLVRYFSAFDLTLEVSDYTAAEKMNAQAKSGQLALSQVAIRSPSLGASAVVSWGTAPDVSTFYGRVPELATLQTWVLEHQCRLITLAGMGGIGKTWLSIKLVEQIQSAFEVVLWRSLRPVLRSQFPLTVDDLLDDLLKHLDPSSAASPSATTHGKIRRLINHLREKPCLLVLDNVESILNSGSSGDAAERVAGTCQLGYEAYCELFRLIGQGRHQSCLILTSREELNRLQPLSGENRQVRRFSLGGLQIPDIQQMFEAKGCFYGSADAWHQLVTYYDGNPFVLETVANTIQRFFGGNIVEFLTSKGLLLDDICELMEQQFGLLSESEKAVIDVLASQSIPCSLSMLRSQLPDSISTIKILGVLKSLSSRSLLNKASNDTVLPSLPSNYVKDYVRAYG